MSLANQIQGMDDFTHERLNCLVKVMAFEPFTVYQAYCRRCNISQEDEALAREIVETFRLEEQAPQRTVFGRFARREIA